MNRNAFIFLLLFLVAGFSNKVFSQSYVKDAIILAEKLNEKVKKNSFNDFKETYPKALAEIEKIISDAPLSEFGYQVVADNASDWIELNKLLSKAEGGKYVFKEEVFEFKITDYKAVLEDAETKTCEAYFLAGKTLLDKSTGYDEKCNSFSLFETSNKYSNLHKAEISEICAKVYYDEALRLSESSELEDMKKAVKLFYESDKKVENYSDNRAKREELRPRIAETIYLQAEETSKTESFEAQEKAADLYLEACKWVKEYKDCTEKEQLIRKRLEVDVFIIDKAGNLVPPQRMEYALKNKLSSNFYTPTPAACFQGIDMNNPANYVEAVKEYGQGIIIIKLGDMSECENNYVANGPEVKTESRNYYTMKKKDEQAEKEIDESTYNASKKIIDFGINNNADAGDRVFKYTGTLTRTVEKVTLTVKYPVEVWDLRDPSNPVKLSSEIYSESYYDQRTTETYDGDVKACPKSLKNETKTLMTKDQLIEKAEADGKDITNIIRHNVEKFAGVINKLEYKHPVSLQ